MRNGRTKPQFPNLLGFLIKIVSQPWSIITVKSLKTSVIHSTVYHEPPSRFCIKLLITVTQPNVFIYSCMVVLFSPLLINVPLCTVYQKMVAVHGTLRYHSITITSVVPLKILYQRALYLDAKHEYNQMKLEVRLSKNKIINK
jgi:hypothetical protein